MTYNWNTMVEITVPTGTNGWLYSGEVIINGVKVRFPVGVPTSVPEPAAVLLKKMIELEQEEDANTAKPQNHYVGDVTIPAGKTLTLEKGAKFVDNSGPSEVVILPETEFPVEDGSASIMTPWSVEPVAGGVYSVKLDGASYECAGVAVSFGGAPAVAMGNSEFLSQMGFADAPENDAPFALICNSNENGASVGIYGVCMLNDDRTSVTLSIVEKAETASAGGGGLFVVNLVKGEQMEESPIPQYPTAFAVEIDKTFAEVLAAFKAGSRVECRETAEDGGVTIYQPIGFGESMCMFSLRLLALDFVVMILPDETAYMVTND